MMLYSASFLIYLIMTMTNISAESIKVNIPELAQLLNSSYCPKAGIIKKKNSKQNTMTMG